MSYDAYRVTRLATLKVMAGMIAHVHPTENKGHSWQPMTSQEMFPTSNVPDQ